MAMKMHLVIMVLEHLTLTGVNTTVYHWFWMAKSKDDAINQVIKEDDVCDKLRQGAKITSVEAFEPGSHLCQFNQNVEWLMTRYNDNSKLLSIKTTSLPKEALQDLQAYANKWCDGVSLS
jgi:hypothetical protein